MYKELLPIITTWRELTKASLIQKGYSQWLHKNEKYMFKPHGSSHSWHIYTVVTERYPNFTRGGEEMTHGYC